MIARSTRHCLPRRPRTSRRPACRRDALALLALGAPAVDASSCRVAGTSGAPPAFRLLPDHLIPSPCLQPHDSGWNWPCCFVQLRFTASALTWPFDCRRRRRHRGSAPGSAALVAEARSRSSPQRHGSLRPNCSVSARAWPLPCRLADHLDPGSAAAVLDVLSCRPDLAGALLGPAGVRGDRVRGRIVRLRDRATVTGAQHAQRGVLVRRAELNGQAAAAADCPFFDFGR